MATVSKMTKKKYETKRWKNITRASRREWANDKKELDAPGDANVRAGGGLVANLG